MEAWPLSFFLWRVGGAERYGVDCHTRNLEPSPQECAKDKQTLVCTRAQPSHKLMSGTKRHTPKLSDFCWETRELSRLTEDILQVIPPLQMTVATHRPCDKACTAPPAPQISMLGNVCGAFFNLRTCPQHWRCPGTGTTLIFGGAEGERIPSSVTSTIHSLADFTCRISSVNSMENSGPGG